ncbi:MAG: tRNA adenosine(34) deaminase TadA [Candidatus Omnitrophica bacterium]|nr:tRNA adenosine(34) deaminase TadA [Candidatus Omnitrophota bacterium]MDD5081707.1 tRNA adenosine(34) deaminase TadA [Candidatus Omnitrophota bacterium]MDD5441163.1 tRNA adenosine(34) deaminase TadA [Candidatus Omnitrophota bacterium]
MLNENKSDESFMLEALRQATYAFKEDEVPVGCVIVKDGKIITKAYNQVEKLKDPTAHAEILAITQACGELGNKWLYDCTLYVTIEPCLMCAGALILSRIKRVVFGARDEKTGAFGSKIDITKTKLNHDIEVNCGILSDECGDIMTEFFRKKRVKVSE